MRLSPRHGRTFARVLLFALVPVSALRAQASVDSALTDYIAAVRAIDSGDDCQRRHDDDALKSESGEGEYATDGTVLIRHAPKTHQCPTGVHSQSDDTASFTLWNGRDAGPGWFAHTSLIRFFKGTASFFR